jgi:hypothetical protein
VASERLSIGGLHGVRDAGEEHTLGLWPLVDADGEPAGGSACEYGLGQACGAGRSKQDRVCAVFSDGDVLGLSPERLTALSGSVDTEDGLDGVSGARGELGGKAHLLGDDERGSWGNRVGCLGRLLGESS